MDFWNHEFFWLFAITGGMLYLLQRISNTLVEMKEIISRYLWRE